MTGGDLEVARRRILELNAHLRAAAASKRVLELQLQDQRDKAQVLGTALEGQCASNAQLQQRVTSMADDHAGWQVRLQC